MIKKAPPLTYHYLVAAIVILNVVFMLLHLRSSGNSNQATHELGFPFEVVSDRLDQEHTQRNIVIMLSKQYYSQANLKAIFRSYTKGYKNHVGMLSVRIYHDKEEIPFLKPSDDKDQDNWDAYFLSTHFNTRGEPLELFFYYPSLDRRDETIRIALKGDPCNANVIDKIIEKWQTANQGFNVRVISFECEDVTPSGTYYAFQVCDINGDDRECHHIMTIRQDKVVHIPSQQVRFVNDRIAYIFMGWKYAVTVDGGESWSVWDAEEELPVWKCCDSTLIRDVGIFPDGSGTMNLNQTLKNSAENLILQTKDYGQHWSSNVK